MRNFFRFILKYHLFFLFLFFEAIAFYLLINYSHHHNTTFVNSSNRVVASLMELSGGFTDYFSLRRSNEELARENAYLRTLMGEREQHSEIVLNDDSVRQDRDYIYRSARVVNNSVNRFHNYITIDKGRNDGIEPEMGVISARGLVGIVRHVSPRYSTVLSLLNTRVRISAKIRDSGYFGSLEWDGRSTLYAMLNEIPGHAEIHVGDAIVTSGYSAIFPPGVLVGIIDSYELLEGEGFYRIKVRLSVDFTRLSYVEVIEKQSILEQKKLERKTEND